MSNPEANAIILCSTVEVMLLFSCKGGRLGPTRMVLLSESHSGSSDVPERAFVGLLSETSHTGRWPGYTVAQWI